MVLGNTVVLIPWTNNPILNGFIISHVCIGKKGVTDVEEATEMKYHLFSDIRVLTTIKEYLLETVGNPFTHSLIYCADVYWVPEI